MLDDTAHTQLLAAIFPLYRQACEMTGTPLPVNRPAKGEHSDDRVLPEDTVIAASFKPKIAKSGSKAFIGVT